MFQSQNIYIYVPIRTKLRLFTKGTVYDIDNFTYSASETAV